VLLRIGWLQQAPAPAAGRSHALASRWSCVTITSVVPLLAIQLKQQFGHALDRSTASRFAGGSSRNVCRVQQLAKAASDRQRAAPPPGQLAWVVVVLCAQGRPVPAGFCVLRLSASLGHVSSIGQQSHFPSAVQTSSSWKDEKQSPRFGPQWAPARLRQRAERLAARCTSPLLADSPANRLSNVDLP